MRVVKMSVVRMWVVGREIDQVSNNESIYVGSCTAICVVGSEHEGSHMWVVVQQCG